MSFANLPEYDHNSKFRWTDSPNPAWKPGDGLGDTPAADAWKSDEELGWKVVDPDTTENRDIYRLMTSGVVPRPVGFVSSLSESGIPNLAPFSWFQMLTHVPPLVMISCTRPTGKGDKDTIANIRATKSFTVNIISEPWVEAANFCSVDCPPDVSEWIGSGLRMEPSTIVKPAWVRESAFAMECELDKLIDVTDPSVSSDTSPAVLQSIAIGRVKLFHVRNAVLSSDDNMSLDPGAFKPVLRLGGDAFARLGDGFRIPRPRWSDVTPALNALEKIGGDHKEDA